MHRAGESPASSVATNTQSAPADRRDDRRPAAAAGRLADPFRLQLIGIHAGAIVRCMTPLRATWLTVKWSMFALLVLAAVGFTALMWGIDSDRAAKSEPTQKDRNLATARYACHEAIMAMLKDPESAEMDAWAFWPAAPLKGDDSIILVQPKIRAANSFGARSLSTFQCSFDVLPDDGGVRLTEVTEH